jgi:hypothetical protein
MVLAPVLASALEIAYLQGASIPTGRIPTGAATRRPVFAGCRSTGSDDAAVLA